MCFLFNDALDTFYFEYMASNRYNHGLYYTSCGLLAGMKNSSTDPP